MNTHTIIHCSSKHYADKHHSSDTTGTKYSHVSLYKRNFQIKQHALNRKGWMRPHGVAAALNVGCATE